MAKKDKVRAELVKAVRKAFIVHGYAKTTIDDIALAAGKAKSTLYYYFKNKEDAFQSVIHYEGEMLSSRLLEIIQDPHRDARQKIEDYILTRWQGFEDLANSYQTMRREFLENTVFVQKYRQQYDAVEMQLIGAILKQGIESGEFDITPEDVEVVAMTIVLSMKALEIPFFAKDKFDDIASKLKSLMNVLFYGIVKN